jgi:hypothetical protein
MGRPRLDQVRLRRAHALAALGAAAAAAVIVAGDAGAPPAIGVPNLAVQRDCVPFGSTFTATGDGFAPGAQVVIGPQIGHYTLPPTDPYPHSVTVTASSSGGVTARLVVPRVPRLQPHHFVAVPIVATGDPGFAGASHESWDTVVLATRDTCRALAREK